MGWRKIFKGITLFFKGEGRGNQSSPTEYKGGEGLKKYDYQSEGIIWILQSLRGGSGKFRRNKL